MTTRTAREVVELYNLVVWNKRDFALAEELIGDTAYARGGSRPHHRSLGHVRGHQIRPEPGGCR